MHCDIINVTHTRAMMAEMERIGWWFLQIDVNCRPHTVENITWPFTEFAAVTQLK